MKSSISKPCTAYGRSPLAGLDTTRAQILAPVSSAPRRGISSRTPDSSLPAQPEHRHNRIVHLHAENAHRRAGGQRGDDGGDKGVRQGVAVSQEDDGQEEKRREGGGERGGPRLGARERGRW